jgi:transcriptional regulator with XRE-family HTH domain
MTKARFENMGARLRELREQAKLTQEGLAHRAGVSSAAIFRIEQGRPSDPKLSTLVALAQALGVTVGRLADELVREDAPKSNGKKK